MAFASPTAPCRDESDRGIVPLPLPSPGFLSRFFRYPRCGFRYQPVLKGLLLLVLTRVNSTVNPASVANEEDLYDQPMLFESFLWGLIAPYICYQPKICLDNTYFNFDLALSPITLEVCQLVRGYEKRKLEEEFPGLLACRSSVYFHPSE